MTPYVTAAIFYLIVTLPLIKVVGIVEKRIARSEKGGGPRPKAKVAEEDAQAEDAEEAPAAAEPSMIEALSAPFRASKPSLGGVADAR